MMSNDKSFFFQNHILLLLLLLSFFSLFSNSFVVEEAATTNFLCVSAVFLFMTMLRRPSSSHATGLSAAAVIGLCLFLAGVLRMSNVYFRCREEQAEYCPQTDFHKPIGTLPKDGDPAYKVIINANIYRLSLKISLFF